ncbi:MAG: NAD(P)H-dependent oxidoreductase [Actinomycetota bacterium]
MPPTADRTPIDVLAFSGSLRRESSNTGLVRMAERLSSEFDGAIRLHIASSIDALPFYNADLEVAGATPEVVTSWRDRVATCDALFIATPEYNFGTTALLKNAIDWVSRPPGQHALRGKTISVMSSSASTGGKHVLEYYTNLFTLLGNTVITEPEGGFIKGAERIGTDGSTSDPSIESHVRARLHVILDGLRS